MGGQPQSATVHKTSISPMLSVRNGAKAIEFYKAAFGAAELFAANRAPFPGLLFNFNAQV